MIIEIIDDFTLLALLVYRSYASQSFLKHKFMIIFLFFIGHFINLHLHYYYSFYLLYHE